MTHFKSTVYKYHLKPFTIYNLEQPADLDESSWIGPEIPGGIGYRQLTKAIRR